MVPELHGYALLYGTSHRLFHRTLDGLTDEQALERPQGANPILWIAGHVVSVRAGFATALGASGVDLPWAGHFRRGGEVKDEAAWPNLGEIRAAWDVVHAAFMHRVEALASAQLAEKTEIPGLDGTLLGALALATFHDAYHVGQLAAARRRYGLARVVG